MFKHLSIKQPTLSINDIQTCQIVDILAKTTQELEIATLIKSNLKSGFTPSEVSKIFSNEASREKNEALKIFDYLKKEPHLQAISKYREKFGEISPQAGITLQKIFKEIIPELRKSNPKVLGLSIFSDKLDTLIDVINTIVAYHVKAITFPAQHATDKATIDYTILKEQLTRQKHPKADNFNIRQENLFKWCHVVISQLVYEPLNALFDKNESMTQKLDQMSLLGTKIAIFDTRIDDIADNIQDKELTEYFTQIPNQFADLERIKEILTTYSDGSFLDFFNQTKELWVEILASFNEITASNSHQIVFFEHIQELMDVMIYSVEINTDKQLEDFNTMLTKLAPNMMVKILYDIQFMLLENNADKPISDFITSIKTELLDLFRMMEKSFHIANCFATYTREIEEEDVTNSIFKLAEIHSEADFKCWEARKSGSFQDYIKDKYLEKEESFTECTKIKSFIDLFHKDTDQNEHDTKLKQKVLKLLVSKISVIDDYFDTWCDLHASIANKIDTIQNIVKTDLSLQDENRDTFVDIFGSFKTNNELFLATRYILEKVANSK